MSCSAKAAPPWPSNDFTGPAADGAVCASVTVLTELSTDWAAVMVRPALVRPVTKLRRDTPFDRYFTTRSRMDRLLGLVPAVSQLASARLRFEIGAEILGHQLDFLGGPERTASHHPVEVRLPGPRILALVLPHRLSVALEALGGDELGACRLLLGVCRSGQQRHAGKRQ